MSTAPSLLVGTAEVDITPAPGVELSGFVAREQPSLGVHDALFARALALSDGARRVIWLHVDLIGLERDDSAAIRARVARAVGGELDVILSATHTHAGPATVRLAQCGAYEAGYVEWLGQRLVEVADVALGRLAPATLELAEGTCTLAQDRRGKPSRHVDPRVGLLAFRRADGTYAAVLANYPMHNVALGPENRFISGDVAGQAARELAAGLPGQPVVLLTNGGAGNLNPPSVGPDIARVRAWGDQLAAAALVALRAAEPVTAPALAVRTAAVTLPFAELTVDEARAIAARHRGYVAGKDDPVSRRCRAATDTWEARMLRTLGADGAADVAPYPAAATLELAALRLGPARLACFGAEVFSIAADELRAAVGAPLYVVGYANGVIGYLAPRFAHEEGGYETGGAFIFYDAPPLAPGGYEVARARMIELLGAL